MQTILKGRIAPTPSGFLHIGNAFSFVLSWVLVKSQAGLLHLRIDDGDASRFRKEYLEDIFFTLDWLGLSPDSGASGSSDFLANYSQQQNQDKFAQLGNQLIANGLAYPCTCSRKQVKERWADGLHAANCQSYIVGKEVAWRLGVSKEVILVQDVENTYSVNLQTEMGDPVIRKKDGSWAYQICSLADDYAQDINFVVRGLDLLPSTALQLYASSLLANTSFKQKAENFESTRFLHHPLLLDDDGNKLSKSAGSTSVKELKKAGVKPAFIYRKVAEYLQIQAKPDTLNNLLQASFESSMVQKLSHLNQSSQL